MYIKGDKVFTNYTVSSPTGKKVVRMPVEIFDVYVAFDVRYRVCLRGCSKKLDKYGQVEDVKSTYVKYFDGCDYNGWIPEDKLEPDIAFNRKNKWIKV